MGVCGGVVRAGEGWRMAGKRMMGGFELSSFPLLSTDVQHQNRLRPEPRIPVTYFGEFCCVANRRTYSWQMLRFGCL